MSYLNIRGALELLDKKLKSSGMSYELFICGGAALYLMGFSGRRTEDVDVLVEYLDENLDRLVASVADEIGVDRNWMNTQVYPLVRTFPANWRDKATSYFKGSNLEVLVIDRQLLINTKLRAAVNRIAGDDEDLLWLRPNERELEKAKRYVLSCNFEGPEVVIDAEIKFLLNEGK